MSPRAAPSVIDPYRAPFRWPEVLPWLAIVAAWFLFPDRLPLGTQVLIAALFALSLDLAMGYAGIATLGHAAYLGLGAYVAGWLGKYGWTEPISGALLAALAAGLLGVATVRVVSKGTPLSGLMVTLALGLLLYEGANKAIPLTGGVDGLQGVVVAPVLGVFEFDFESKTAYVYAAAWLAVALLAVRHIVGSPLGLSLQAIRLNPRRSAALGVHNGRALSIAYTVSTALAGLAGALLTQTTQYVAIDALAFHRSADVLTMLIIGGVGYLYGGLVGAAAFVILRETLSGINPVYWEFWLGLALVLIVLFLHEGVVGSAIALRERWARRRGGTPRA